MFVLSIMSHRSRSKTVDSAEGKKPRRLTEKIAIMKKREHEQLEAFEHAMQSIHEVSTKVQFHGSVQGPASGPPNYGHMCTAF